MSRSQFKCWKPFVPITGTFGRLTVIEFAGFHTKWNRSMWLVECVCGTRKVVLGNSLLTGHCTSCGCRGREKMILRNRQGKGIVRGPRHKTT